MSTMPDARGRFGDFGGRFVPETVMGALDELLAAWQTAWSDPAFHRRLDVLARDYVGRPSPLYRAERLEQYANGARIYLKREDLNHTGAHKINNAVGQALLAERLGKRRIVAETGAGQHGVASATVCARFGLDCHVYMGEEDIRRQHPNVVRMRMLGAEVIPVTAGSGTLKDAMNEAIRDWITNVEDTHYLIGSAAGPHPYPVLVRELQSVIGREAREQVLAAEGRLPDLVVACVGGGSNAIGLFHPFIEDADVRLLGAEAGGDEQRHGCDAVGGAGVGAARLEELRAGRRGRPGAGDALDLGRTRLPRGRPGTRLAEGHRPRPVRAGHRRAGAGGVPPAVHARGHHPGARVGTRAVAGAAAGAARAGRGGGAFRARRQGRGRGRGAGVAGMRIETPALVIYLMADHDTVELAEAAVRGGATALEIGIPFSDPLADGPTVQRAGQRALRNGMTATRALKVIGELRTRIPVPLIPMTYAGPVMAYGEERFCADLAAAGADGMIVPDVPHDEAGDLIEACRRNGLDMVPMLAPTSTDERIELACKDAGGFVYLVSVAGITGSRQGLSDRVAPLVGRVRPHTELPLLVGFGIASGATAREVMDAGADGVVIGSKAIEVAEQGGAEGLERFVAEVATAITK